MAPLAPGPDPWSLLGLFLFRLLLLLPGTAGDGGQGPVPRVKYLAGKCLMTQKCGDGRRRPGAGGRGEERSGEAERPGREAEGVRQRHRRPRPRRDRGAAAWAKAKPGEERGPGRHLSRLSQTRAFLSLLKPHCHQAGHLEPVTAFTSPGAPTVKARARRTSADLVTRDAPGPSQPHRSCWARRVRCHRDVRI